MRGRRLAAAVLHLVVGGLFALPDAEASAGDADDNVVVVDVILAPTEDNPDADSDADRLSARAETAAALAAAGVDVAVIDGGIALTDDSHVGNDVAVSLVRDALAACRAAGTLKVIVRPTGLSIPDLRAVAQPLGFRFAGIRPDGAAHFYRDLYARR